MKPDEKKVHIQYALLAVNVEGDVQVIKVFSKRGRMTQEHNKRKKAGESDLIKTKIHFTIEDVY